MNHNQKTKYSVEHYKPTALIMFGLGILFCLWILSYIFNSNVSHLGIKILMLIIGFLALVYFTLSFELLNVKRIFEYDIKLIKISVLTLIFSLYLWSFIYLVSDIIEKFFPQNIFMVIMLSACILLVMISLYIQVACNWRRL